jgi:hypothetical protein
MSRRSLGSALLVLAAVAALEAGPAGAAAPVPTIEGPVTGGAGQPFVSTTSFDLAKVGYEQAEYFISGTASAYTSAAPLTSDGHWTVTPGATAAYKTRILVYRPKRTDRFDGTVVVEWLNVSGGLDAGPDWTAAHTELVREGAAWVGVSAQRVGVEGGMALVGVVSLPLKTVDPARYGSLVHPGDSFSYDIFSQAAEAVRHPADVNPLGRLKPKRVIAAGESQSAFRLVTYIDAVHPLAQVFDGFLVHSRGGGSVFGAPLSEAPQPLLATPLPTLIRTDLQVPVLTFETETDLTFLFFYAARQPDTDRLRTWEVAGTSHADAYLVVQGPSDLGRSPDVAGLVLTAEPVAGILQCGADINSGPQHFVLNAAFAALDRWVRTGRLPPHGTPIDAGTGPTAVLARDAHGNAVGGIRTPQVDVPIASFTGEQNGSILCRLFGTTTPFDAATLAGLYPTHGAFVSAFGKATKQTLRAGFIVPHDASLMRRWAARSDVGR